MELKYHSFKFKEISCRPLIVPYGIEINLSHEICRICFSPLIVPYGIEIRK